MHNQTADPVPSASAPLTAQHRALQRWFADRITDTGGDWRERALCAQVDPEIFHPEKGGSPRPAKLICRMCPVQVECLETALANNEMFGIWGGLTAHERTAFRRGTARERTHCKNGHEYTPENTRISTSGFRRCRTCDNAYQRECGAAEEGGAVSGPVARQGVEGSMRYPNAAFVAQRGAQSAWDAPPGRRDRHQNRKG